MWEQLERGEKLSEVFNLEGDSIVQHRGHSNSTFAQREGAGLLKKRIKRMLVFCFYIKDISP